MAKRIVIIEDDHSILELLIYLFETEGYLVSHFVYSQTAVDIGLLCPDIILLDVSLAGSPKHGNDVCKELKNFLATRALPVMLLSAEKDLEAIAKDCSADDFLCKPFNIDELLDKVKLLAA